MPSYEFTIHVDAVKHVPIAPDTRYQARWFLNDDRKGTSAVTSKVGDEVSFMFADRFVVDTRGIITQLLQVSVLEVNTQTDESRIAGVLMIDLNAHVPKPPRTSSKQRATLSMSRCPFPTPLLVRLTLECALNTNPVPTPGAPSPVPSRGPSISAISPLPRAVADASRGVSMASRDGSVNTPVADRRAESTRDALERAASTAAFDETAAQFGKMRDVVSSLSAANDQLRDENTLLQRALDRARNEAEYTFSTKEMDSFANETQPGFDGVQPAAAGSATEEDMRILKAEMAVLRRGLAAAKDSLRQAMDKEKELRKEISALTRGKAFHADEAKRLQADLDAARASQTKDVSAELSATREMLVSSQQMCRDLRAMVNSSDTLTESLKKELALARKDATEADNRRHEAVRIAEQRATEAESRAERAAAALRLGQQELVKLHSYGVQMNQQLTQTLGKLNEERAAHRRTARQLDDYRAISAAQNKFNASGVNASSSSALVRSGAPYFADDSAAIDAAAL